MGLLRVFRASVPSFNRGSITTDRYLFFVIDDGSESDSQ